MRRAIGIAPQPAIKYKSGKNKLRLNNKNKTNIKLVKMNVQYLFNSREGKQNSKRSSETSRYKTKKNPHLIPEVQVRGIAKYFK